MKRDVIIGFKVRLKTDAEEDERIDLISMGVLEQFTEEHYKITYDEIEDFAVTETTIFVEPNQISLLRRGEINSTSSFELKKRHQSIYNTPYGAMDMEVYTRILKQNISFEGGQIILHYDLRISDKLISKNYMQIDVALPRPREL